LSNFMPSRTPWRKKYLRHVLPTTGIELAILILVPL
jgi:hypothetical protein